MIKTTLKIDGMMCGMCEAHVAEAIRRAVPAAKKVSASRSKGEATFLTEDAAGWEAACASSSCRIASLRRTSCRSRSALFTPSGMPSLKEEGVKKVLTALCRLLSDVSAAAGRVGKTGGCAGSCTVFLVMRLILVYFAPGIIL